jgi:hypothetical protein
MLTHILAETKSGKSVEICGFAEPYCTAYSHSANPYPMPQREADERGYRTQKRDLLYNLVGVGEFPTLARIANLYTYYMSDPIVCVVGASDSEAAELLALTDARGYLS